MSQSNRRDAPNEPADDRGSIFESLDIDQMLAAQPKPARKVRMSPAVTAGDRKAKKRTPELNAVASETASVSASPKANETPRPPKVRTPTPSDTANADGAKANLPQSTSSWDSEDRAVFDAVSRQHRRRRRWLILLMLVASVLWGGWFLNREIQMLRQPLSAAERRALREQGFAIEPEPGEVAIPTEENKSELQGVALSADPSISLERIESLANGEHDLDDVAATSLAGKRIKKKPRSKPSKKNANTKAVLRQQQQDAHQATRIEQQRQQLRDYSNAVDLSTDFQIELEGQNNAAAISPRNHIYFDDSNNDGTRIRVFDLETSTEIAKRSFPGRFGTVTEMVASSDGRFLVVATDKGHVIEYRIDADGSIMRVHVALPVMNGPVRRMTIDDSSRWLVACCEGGDVLRWDLDSKTVSGSWSSGLPANEIVDLSVEKSSGEILAWTGDSTWTFGEAGRRPVATSLESDGLVLVVLKEAELSDWSRMLISDDRELKLVDAQSGEVIWKRQPDGIANLKFFSDRFGQLLLMFRPRNELLVLKPSDAQVSARWQLPADVRITDGIHFAGRGDYLFLTGQRNKLLGTRLQREGERSALPLAPPVPLPTRMVPPMLDDLPKEGITLAALEIDPVEVNDIRLRDDGLLFIATTDGRVVAIDWTSGTIVDEIFFASDERPTTLAIESTALLVGMQSGSVKIFQIEAAGRLRLESEKAFHVGAVALLENTNRPNTVAIAFAEGNLKVWNAKSDEITVDVWPLKRAPVQMVVSDDVVTLVTSNEIATVDIEGARVKTSPLQGLGSTFAVSPEGTKLAFARGQYVDVGNTRDKRVTSRIDATESVTGLAFPGDSGSVLVATDSKTGIYRIRTGKEIFTYPALFSNRGGLHVAVSNSGNLMIVYQRKWDGNMLVRTVPQ